MPSNARRRTTTRPRPAAVAASDAPAATAAASLGAAGLLLRFVSCGVLAIALGLLWKETLAPSRVGVGSALLGLLFLLSGFIVGGIGWYLKDARARMRDPQSVPDERIIFSFVVFALVPFMVLAFIGVIWLIALVVGAGAG